MQSLTFEPEPALRASSLNFTHASFTACNASHTPQARAAEAARGGTEQALRQQLESMQREHELRVQMLARQ